MQVTSGFSKDNIKVEMKEEVIDLNEVVKYSDEESMVWETNKDDFMNNKTLLDMTCTAKGIEDACSATFETESNLAQLNLGSAFVRPELYYCPNSISASQSGAGKGNQRLALDSRIRMILPPRKLFRGWCNTKRANIIMEFLVSYANIARQLEDSRCAHYNIVSSGPRSLTCDNCSRLFSGLHDRYLKIFVHFKACHKKTCNLLIGLKWVKHQATVRNMISAWQRDMQSPQQSEEVTN